MPQTAIGLVIRGDDTWIVCIAHGSWGGNPIDRINDISTETFEQVICWEDGEYCGNFDAALEAAEEVDHNVHQKMSDLSRSDYQNVNYAHKLISIYHKAGLPNLDIVYISGRSEYNSPYKLINAIRDVAKDWAVLAVDQDIIEECETDKIYQQGILPL